MVKDISHLLSFDKPNARPFLLYYTIFRYFMGELAPPRLLPLGQRASRPLPALRHLDRHLEEAVERVRGIQPLAAATTPYAA